VLSSASHSFFANLDYANAVIHVLDDLKGGIHAGGFGEGFQEGILSLMLHSAKSMIIDSFE